MATKKTIFRCELHNMVDIPLGKSLNLRKEIEKLIQEHGYTITGSGYNLTTNVLDIGFRETTDEDIE